jgi:hypothetical protein
MMDHPRLPLDGYEHNNYMIGSLAEFIPIENEQVFEDLAPTEAREGEPLPSSRKRRGQSAFEVYQPQDKTELLLHYEKNNIFHINRKKATSLAREAQSKAAVRRPLYEHRSFFVKPEVARDYIAKEEYPFPHADSSASTTC